MIKIEGIAFIYFCIRRNNNNKVSSIKTGHVVIGH